MRILCCIFLCVVLGVCEGQVKAQNLEQQRKRYIEGDREPKFLKEYIEALKIEKAVAELNKVVDVYLMVLPLSERYTGENFVDFLTYVVHVNAKSLTDIVSNWNRVDLKGERLDKVTRKIEEICTRELFQAMLRQEQVDCSRIRMALKDSDIPVSGIRRLMIDMWEFRRQANVNGMLQVFEQMMQKGENEQNDINRQLNLFFDGAVLGGMLDYILEVCDFEQCNRWLKIADCAIKNHGKEGIMEMIVKTRDNFAGKKMMMKMGEE